MRLFSRCALAIFFVGAGVFHFLRPGPYLAIMPPWVPRPAAMVALSGGAEILGGLGILLRPTRKAAGWGLITLLIAVFPANLQGLSTGIVVNGWRVPPWLLWARLPFQIFFIAWVYRAALRGSGAKAPESC